MAKAKPQTQPEDTSAEKPQGSEATAKPAKKEKEPKAPKDERNGVTRPTTGVTGRVWVIADEISAKKKAPAERAEVTEIALAENINVGTIHTQFGRWRKYYGLVTPKEERAKQLAEAKVQKEAEKAAKKAEKEAAAAAKAEAKAQKEAEAAAKAKAKAEAEGETGPADDSSDE